MSFAHWHNNVTTSMIFECHFANLGEPATLQKHALAHPAFSQRKCTHLSNTESPARCARRFKPVGVCQHNNCRLYCVWKGAALRRPAALPVWPSTQVVPFLLGVWRRLVRRRQP